MVTSSDPIEWRNSSVLKVKGVTARPGTFISREGKVTPFTKELCKTLFSNFDSSTPSYLTHDDRDPCGYMYKFGYDPETDYIHYEGFVFDKNKAEKIQEEGFDFVSPELELDVEGNNVLNGKITGVAFVRKPSIQGTTVEKQLVAFSTPSHRWDYGESTSAWSKPSLQDFTDKSWDELSNKEKRDVAGHYAYSANMPPVSFGDLKFPHHEPKSHNVVWSAVSNAMARLKQSNISESDKKAVYKHLSEHYKEFNKEPPRMFDDGSVENMVNSSYNLTTSDGSYVFTPGTITVPNVGQTQTAPTTQNVTYGVAEDPKEKEIADLRKEVETLKNTVVKPTVQSEQPPVPVQQPTVNPYKEKYEGVIKTQLDSVIGELKNLGAKNVENIGVGLDSEQRYAMLRALKETMVINAPTTTPPETIVTHSVGESNELKIDKIMKEAGIDPEYKKYLKNR